MFNSFRISPCPARGLYLLAAILLCHNVAPAQTAAARPLDTIRASEINTIRYIDPSSKTDIVSQINDLFAACSSHCEVHIPTGVYKSSSSSPILMQSAAQSLVGDGSGSVSITFTSAVALSWHVTDGSFFTKAGRLQGITFICAPASTHCIDAGDSNGATFRDLVIYGAKSGDGVYLHNTHQWMERTVWDNVHVGLPHSENAIGIHIAAPAAPGTDSYGYQSFLGVWFNIPNGGKGLQVDSGANLYHAAILNLSFNLNNPVTGDGTEVIRVAGQVSAGLCSLVGEPSTGGTGYVLGHLLGQGYFLCKGSAAVYGNAAVHVDGPAGTGQPRWSLLSDNEILQVSAGAGSIADWNGTGTAMGIYPISIPGNNSEENAAFGFLIGGDRVRTPFLAFDPRSFFCAHTWQLYQTIAQMHPVSCIDGAGNSRQSGSASFGGNTQLAGHAPGISGITINGVTPAIFLNATSAAPDQRITALTTSSDGALHLQFLRDNAAAGPDLMRITRGAGNSGVVAFPSGVATPQATPASSQSPCTPGQIWSDAAYIYVCVAPNTIKRSALSSF
jgi:hypothetical protein